MMSFPKETFPCLPNESKQRKAPRFLRRCGAPVGKTKLSTGFRHFVRLIVIRYGSGNDSDYPKDGLIWIFVDYVNLFFAFHIHTGYTISFVQLACHADFSLHQFHFRCIGEIPKITFPNVH